MKPFSSLFLIFIFTFGCSQVSERSLNDSLVITSEKEIISDIESLENKLLKYMNSASVQKISIDDIFKNSWLSSIKTDHFFDNSISVEIKEHQPIASINGERYITQRGYSISPEGDFKELGLVNIEGPEDYLVSLVDLSRQLQTKLNKLDLKVVSFVLKNKDQLKAIDELGTEYIFSLKEFRVQLERLEDFISFELNSGKRNHIRYMDFRYNNAVAIYRS